jgi:F-type H+-transporting ATPase subunit b
MEIITTNALITINATFFVQLISFLLFMLVMNRIMYQPLRSAMAQREGHLKKLQLDIDNAQERMNRFSKELETQRGAVRREAFSINVKLEKQANDQADEMVAAARQKARNLRDETERTVAKQLMEAKQAFAEETETLASTIMERILERSLAK